MKIKNINYLYYFAIFLFVFLNSLKLYASNSFLSSISAMQYDNLRETDFNFDADSQYIISYKNSFLKKINKIDNFEQCEVIINEFDNLKNASHFYSDELTYLSLFSSILMKNNPDCLNKILLKQLNDDNRSDYYEYRYSTIDYIIYKLIESDDKTSIPLIIKRFNDIRLGKTRYLALEFLKTNSPHDFTEITKKEIFSNNKPYLDSHGKDYKYKYKVLNLLLESKNIERLNICKEIVNERYIDKYLKLCATEALIKLSPSEVNFADFLSEKKYSELEKQTLLSIYAESYPNYITWKIFTKIHSYQYILKSNESIMSNDYTKSKIEDKIEKVNKEVKLYNEILDVLDKKNLYFSTVIFLNRLIVNLHSGFLSITLNVSAAVFVIISIIALIIGGFAAFGGAFHLLLKIFGREDDGPTYTTVELLYFSGH